MSSDVVRWTTSPTTVTTEKKNKNRKSVEKMAFSTSSSWSGIGKSLVVVLCIVINLNLVVLVKSDEWLNAEGARGHYTPTWAVHVEGGDEVAALVADEHGFTNLGKVRSHNLSLSQTVFIYRIFNLSTLFHHQNLRFMYLPNVRTKFLSHRFENCYRNFV